MTTLAREHLLSALTADLIGPYDPNTGLEVLKLPPSRWYLTGFLVPEGGSQPLPSSHTEEDDTMEAGDDISSDAESSSPEPEPKQRPIMPSSFGLTVLLPASSPTDPDTLDLNVTWGEYLCRSTVPEVEALCRARGMDAKQYLPNDRRKQPVALWERIVLPTRTVTLNLANATDGRLHKAPVQGGLELEYRIETISAANATTLRITDNGQPARALRLSRQRPYDRRRS